MGRRWELLLVAFTIVVSTAAIFNLDGCGTVDVDLISNQWPDTKLVATVLASYPSTTSIFCVLACEKHYLCKSVNIHTSGTCELNSKDSCSDGVLLTEKSGWTLMETAANKQDFEPTCDGVKRCQPNMKCAKAKDPAEDACHANDMAIKFRPTYEGESYPAALARLPEDLNGLSLCLWFKKTADFADERQHTIVSMHSTTNAPNGCNQPKLYTTNVGALFFLDVRSVEEGDKIMFRNLNWNHICMIWDPSYTRTAVYINGTQIGLINTNATAYRPLETYRIVLANDADGTATSCNVSDRGEILNGEVSHAHIWSYALNSEEIKDVQNFRYEKIKNGCQYSRPIDWQKFKNLCADFSHICEESQFPYKALL